jgi:hypothetical protein
VSAAFLIKLFASPALIGLASLAGKRWGPNVAGLLGGLPLVGGPVVVALWLSHGSAYATDVALAAPVGVWANIAYMLVFGYASAYLRWWGALALVWFAYLAAGIGLGELGLARNVWLGLTIVPGLWCAAVYWLPKPAAPPQLGHLPRIELLARVLAAAALVLLLTGISSAIGPTLTGVFTGAPVAASVIPSFTFANAGRDALLLVLRGFLTGLMGFCVFFFVLGVGIPALGGFAILAALLSGVAVGVLATRLSRHVA